MPVPFHANFFAGWLYHFFKHKFDECGGAHGSGVSSGIAEHETARAEIDGGGVELLHRFRIAARGVFGDVHDLEAERNSVLDGLFGGLQKEGAIPALGVAAERTRSD